MEYLTQQMTEMEVYGWEEWIGNWFFLLSLIYLAFELIRYVFIKQFNFNLLGDTVTNFLTLFMFIGVTILIAGIYISGFFYIHQFAIFDIGVNWATILICIVLADLAYYWEHRFMHRMNFAWATHTVHHSSPYFNISVAYRFGPMDGIWPFFFHAPLVLLGFNPFVVFFSEALVQFYQTALHTEAIKKFPEPVEAVMNTPSHHRVHHGSNEEYLDTNYAGIFIIWDKMFGTFAEEKNKVVYGLVKPINSINPFVAFFHGFYRIGKKMSNAKGLGNKIAYFFLPPEWVAKNEREFASAPTAAE